MNAEEEEEVQSAEEPDEEDLAVEEAASKCLDLNSHPHQSKVGALPPYTYLVMHTSINYLLLCLTGGSSYLTLYQLKDSIKPLSLLSKRIQCAHHASLFVTLQPICLFVCFFMLWTNPK